MKVLHVIDGVGVGGGAEESLVEMLPLLRDIGIDSRVVCLFDRQGHEAGLRHQGFRVDVLGGTNILLQAFHLRRIIRDEAPDLVHASLIHACFASRLACFALRTPQLNSLVNTTYDPVRLRTLGISSSKIQLLRIVDIATSKLVRGGFHALTQTVAAEATSVLRISPRLVTVVPRGRDEGRLGRYSDDRRAAMRDSLEVDNGELVILNVGRQDPQKGKTYLVDAFSHVLGEQPNAILLIAGREGNDTARLKAVIQASPARARIRLLGHRTDIPDLLCAADVLVLPSLYEGLGGTLIEAMAMRCPIVGSDAPAVAEVLGHGAFGRVVPRGDEVALATTLLEILADPEARLRLTQSAREQYESMYELHRVVAAMADLYDSLVDTPGSRVSIGTSSRTAERSRRDSVREPRVADHRLLRYAKRAARGFSRIAEIATSKVVVQVADPRPGQETPIPPGLYFASASDLRTYRRFVGEIDLLESAYAHRRFDRGSVFVALVANGVAVSTAWVSAPGIRVSVREIGRTLTLGACQRVIFDLNTHPDHQGRGLATLLLRLSRSQFSHDQLICYALASNERSLRAMRTAGFECIGSYSWRSSHLGDTMATLRFRTG